MTKEQQCIKNNMEQMFYNFFGEKIEIEYVDDVKSSVESFLQEYGLNMREANSANVLTGSFLPATSRTNHKIFIKRERNDCLDVMTAFHEIQHAIDYVKLLREVFYCDQEKMKNSELYESFQLFSEYNAVRFGIKNYLQLVEKENMTKTELAQLLLDGSRKTFLDYSTIHNRWQLAFHIFEYLGAVHAVKELFYNMDLQEYESLLEQDNAKYIIDAISSFEFSEDWFSFFNLRIRKFVNNEIQI